VAGTLLVTNENVAKLGGVHERVIHGQNCAARKTEHVFDPEEFKTAHNGLRARHESRFG
jgi:hypothetical protein